ncbi:hypothetical protein [Bacillus sp. UNC322MFChir4.1]|uniref:hypothetical protein n=1 Tax=Bacillus sp. UNC322MFChir4.1 TaxID=1449045 RepID=UPI0012E0864F|nr:hypothetical protein [Bacillus sp. UNC322MFChir4.1]
MKNSNAKTPIVFIPGLFGSMSNFIIPGTGDGNVIANSVFLLDGDKYVVQGTHNEVLYKMGTVSNCAHFTSLLNKIPSIVIPPKFINSN